MNFKGDAIKLGELDITHLRNKVAELSAQDWDADSHRQERFEAHAHTKTIALLFDPDYRHESPTEHPPLKQFQPLIKPFVDHIFSCYNQTMRQRKVIAKHGAGYLIRIILTKLAPHSSIAPHNDDGYSLARCHRIHVPVISHDAVSFHVGESSINMKPGEIWEINNRRIHQVDNNSDQARIHLIIDFVQPGETVFDLDGPVTA